MDGHADWVIIASMRHERSRPYHLPSNQSPDGRCPLARALQRALRLTTSDKIIPVVLDEHKPWWSSLLSRIPRRNLVIEPFDRGTAAGLALAAIRLMARDPTAHVAVLPADSDSEARECTTLYLRAVRLSARWNACAAVGRNCAIEPLGRVPISEIEMIAGKNLRLIRAMRATRYCDLEAHLSLLPNDAIFSPDALQSIYPFLTEARLSLGAQSD